MMNNRNKKGSKNPAQKKDNTKRFTKTDCYQLHIKANNSNQERNRMTLHRIDKGTFIFGSTNTINTTKYLNEVELQKIAVQPISHTYVRQVRRSLNKKKLIDFLIGVPGTFYGIQ